MTTTTTLVHRPYDGPEEWWRHALVYEVPSPVLGAADLEHTDPIIEHALHLGMDAVLIRPSLLDVGSELDSIRRFIDNARALGLRTVVRVSGALGPITGPYARRTTGFITGLEGPGDDLLRRSEAYLQAGAAGIDLGTIVPPQVASETRLDRLSAHFAMLHGQLAEYVENGIVGADVTADYPDSLRHHLQDDWVHHLRDDCLTLTRWNAESLTAHLTRSLDEHDRFGAPPTWRFLPPHILSEHLDPGDGQRWYSVDHDERLLRGLALQAMMLALPGSLYLRQGDEIALSDADKPTTPLELASMVAEHAQAQSSQFGSPAATVRHAAHVRDEYNLACAPMAFVTGLEWCPPEALVFLVRGVLVVVNTSDSPIILSAEAKVLLSSQPLRQDQGRLLVPPTTTTWLEAVTVA